MHITPEQLLLAYEEGIFPMAANKHEEELHWFCPEMRGIIPLDDFHIPGSLKKFIKKTPFEIRVDTAFSSVINACAEINRTRPSTWINQQIAELFNALHRQGHAHSVETWENGELVGGLYGIARGGAFFGESMFSRRTNASKVALVCLVEHLKKNGFILLDSQFKNDHLEQFGCVEIPRSVYLQKLWEALDVKAEFTGK